ncbi:MAG: hypothetical protein KF729_34470 [Sandaracinaceae bacterium]|nr:hypothetical protein [Sandaracinaceae bacterium]
MASEKNDERVASEGVTVTSAEFRADARAVIREVSAGKTVTVTGKSGEPRMFILRQTEPLED